MKIVLAHNHYDQSHLDAVVDQMRDQGAPTIRVYDLEFDGLVQAIEGCHRLRAAEILGIEPELEFIDKGMLCSDVDGLDFDGAEYVYEIGDWENYSIEV